MPIIMSYTPYTTAVTLLSIIEIDFTLQLCIALSSLYCWTLHFGVPRSTLLLLSQKKDRRDILDRFDDSVMDEKQPRC